MLSPQASAEPHGTAARWAKLLFYYISVNHIELKEIISALQTSTSESKTKPLLSWTER